MLVASDEQIKRLNAARFQLDIMRVPGIIVARTDARAPNGFEALKPLGCHGTGSGWQDEAPSPTRRANAIQTKFLFRIRTLRFCGRRCSIQPMVPHESATLRPGWALPPRSAAA